MDEWNEAIEEEKIAREGLRNKHELVQIGDVTIMKHKGKHLLLNYPSGELIINEDKDFPCTFESYARLLVLHFSTTIKAFSNQFRDAFFLIKFNTINRYFQKLKELAHRDIKDKQKLKYYLNIITQNAELVKAYKQELLNENPNSNYYINSTKIIPFFSQILSKISEIDEDIKKSYKVKK